LEETKEVNISPPQGGFDTSYTLSRVPRRV